MQVTMLWSILLLSAFQHMADGQDERPVYSACTIPKDYEKQLNIIPIPRDNKVEHGQTITVLCRTSGYTFMNHMYSVGMLYSPLPQ